MRTVILSSNGMSAREVRRSLRGSPSCRVLGYVDSNSPCEAALRTAAPNVVVIDDLRDADVLTSRVSEARQAAPNAKLILLTSATNPASLSAAFAAGVDATIAKSAGGVCVGILVAAVAAGVVFTPLGGAAPATVRPSPAIDGLTRRELEILRLVAAGWSNSRIAARLWVTEQTVKFHLSNVYRKLGVSNRTEASHFAHLHALVDGGEEAAAVPAAA